MNIKEVKERMIETQEEIKNVLNKFTIDPGLSVTYIDIDIIMRDPMGGYSVIKNLSIEARNENI